MGQRSDQLDVAQVFHVLEVDVPAAPDVVEQTRPAHLEFLKAEIDAGRMLLAGRQEDGSGGVLITGDISAEEARTSSSVIRNQGGRCALRAVVVQRRIPGLRALGLIHSSNGNDGSDRR